MKPTPPPTPFSTPWNFFRKGFPLCGKIAKRFSIVWKNWAAVTSIFPHCGKKVSTPWKKSFHTVEKSLPPRRALLVALLASPLLAVAAPAAPADPAHLAQELAATRQHNAAAIEYRRLALADPAPDRAASWFWLAAQQYASDHNPAQANRMLDRAEDTAPGLLAAPVAWLRAENALALRDWDSAGFYFDSLRRQAAADPLRDFAARGATAAALRRHDLPAARAALATAPDAIPAAAAALDTYAARRDKKPWLGGLLGLVPGLGYAYSGEYANATRSLILNSLFLWGMIETADDDQWAAFTVLTFVEFTWYSGSIYGGLDAAHRHNQRRLDAAITDIRGTTRAQPDFTKLPILVWQFEF